MNKYDRWLDGYVDSINLSIDFVDKSYRDEVYKNIINYIKNKDLVGIQYDKKKSNSYFQITKLISSNTTIATLTKKAFTPYFVTQFRITIGFHGLHRYNKKVDDKSKLLLQNIAAYLNAKDIHFVITQFDICTDIPCPIEELVVMCVNRKSSKKYHPLGTYDEDGNKIQTHDTTYEVEKFKSKESRDNVMKRAYLYDKRIKEIDKANNDIGFDLTRFEMKLQNRFFLKNEVSANSFLQELKDYKILYFEDIKQKDEFIKQYNKVNTNKHRDQLVDDISKTTPEIRINMLNISDFIRMVDTIRSDSRGGFIVTRSEDYLYGISKFNK